MQFFTLLTGLALATLTAAQSSTQQACPSDSVNIYEACVCPYGTDYQFSDTWAILGVNAKDFKHYTASFYDLAWQGITNLTLNGPDETPGSTRTFAAGPLSFTQKLDSWQTRPDGSYLYRISQFNVPLKYANGNGTYSGYWITFEADYVAEYETALKWSIYACFTGNPFNFGQDHVKSLNNLLKTMDKAGLVKGKTLGPYYAQTF